MSWSIPKTVLSNKKFSLAEVLEGLASLIWNLCRSFSNQKLHWKWYSLSQTETWTSTIPITALVAYQRYLRGHFLLIDAFVSY